MAGAPQAATPSMQARLQTVRYAEKEYWDTRYKSQPCEFDWFYGYTALRKIVRAFIKRSKPVLHVGCGNSNFQEGMAKDGYQVVNTDISEVVIEQMREKHKAIASLRYVVSDCRSMPEFLDCQFGSVIDKGTVDALLCSKDAADNIRSMFREISRVLVPGGVFLLITLGGPAQRFSLVNRPEFDWRVQVCLVRRVAEDQYAPSAPGRPIPLNDTIKALSYIGPLEVQPDGTVVGLPEPFDPATYFYAYLCRRSPLVLRHDNQCGAGGKARLPEGWRATVKAVAEVVGGELKLPQGILGRGRRVKTTSRASFEREQRERELERERERLRLRILAERSCSAPQLQEDLLQLLQDNRQDQQQQQEQHQQQVRLPLPPWQPPPPQQQQGLLVLPCEHSIPGTLQTGAADDGSSPDGAGRRRDAGGSNPGADVTTGESRSKEYEDSPQGVQQGASSVGEAGAKGEGEDNRGGGAALRNGIGQLPDPGVGQKTEKEVEEAVDDSEESLRPRQHPWSPAAAAALTGAAELETDADEGLAGDERVSSAGFSTDSATAATEQWECGIVAASMLPNGAAVAAGAAAAASPPPPLPGHGLHSDSEAADAQHRGPRLDRGTLDTTRAISYRRLSATVQHAFAVLDAVDGTGCSSGCDNSLADPATANANELQNLTWPPV